MDVKLDQFIGPLDLLLQMIEEEKLDITEISLAKIADQYIEYIEQNTAIDPDEVADFLVIAARLLLIKSKTLLPYLMREEDEEEIRDFAQQLKIYKDFVTAARCIEEMFARGNVMHSRDTVRQNENERLFYPPPNVSLGVMQSALTEIIERLRPQAVLAEESIAKAVSIEERMADIRAALQKLQELSFHSLFDAETSRIDVIVSFMAVLEMMKRKSICVRQSVLFGDIVVYNTN